VRLERPGNQICCGAQRTRRRAAGTRRRAFENENLDISVSRLTKRTRASHGVPGILPRNGNPEIRASAPTRARTTTGSSRSWRVVKRKCLSESQQRSCRCDAALPAASRRNVDASAYVFMFHVRASPRTRHKRVVPRPTGAVHVSAGAQHIAQFIGTMGRMCGVGTCPESGPLPSPFYSSGALTQVHTRVLGPYAYAIFNESSLIYSCAAAGWR